MHSHDTVLGSERQAFFCTSVTVMEEGQKIKKKGGKCAGGGQDTIPDM